MNVPSAEIRPKLTRMLDVRDSVALVTGVMVGVGIFRIPTEVARELGAVGPILLVWALGGGMSFLGSLIHAELASAWPRTGGIYVSFRECFGPLTSFLFGWGQLLIVRPAWLAVIAIVFADYMEYFLPPDGGSTGALIAICAILAASIVTSVGVQVKGKLQNRLTVVKVAALLLIVVSALLVAGGSGFHPPGAIDRFVWDRSGLSAMGAALVMIYWTYDGWSELSMVAGEIETPGKTIHRSLILGCAGVTALYLLVNIAFLNVLSVPGVAGSRHVASDVMVRLLGPFGGILMAALLVVATFGALNSTALAGSRLFFTMAVDGNFFSWARRVETAVRTPIAANVIQALLAIPLIWFWSLAEIVTCYIFVSLLFHLGAVLALVCLRRKADVSPERYRAWGHPFTSIVFAGGTAALLGNICIRSFSQAAVGSLVLLSGIPVFLIWKRFRAVARAAR
ncbi:MAG: amino acid permease [Pseudomonadota bacterium]